MFEHVKADYQSILDEMADAGLMKDEYGIQTPQGRSIKTGRGTFLNFCANNYLGLSNHPELVKAAREGLDEFGFGLSSVRFICGTQTIHRDLEARLSQFMGMEETILYTSCFDANGGLFETLLDVEDAIISDQLNHASIIDGIRLCKARRLRYRNGDMADLEDKLKAACESGARRKLISTDGVFSMDGHIAPLAQICDLAEKYGAMVHVDDSHATGFVGPKGRGTHEHCGVMDRIDVMTSTLGKALGGASGGYTSGKREIIRVLRQKSRPYLFSNSLPPVLVKAAIAAIDLLESSTELRDRLEENTVYFRKAMTQAGLNVIEGVHPIVPVLIGEARKATDMARYLLDKGIYVIGFCYPVVPMGQARIRVQVSAAHTREDLDRAIVAFRDAGQAFGCLK